jgi:hypothetical protein
MTNGDFSSGVLAPWIAFGTITSQVASGVAEFVRPTSTPPAGAILQLTGQPAAAGDILTAGFELGNSSSVRKRVTILLHDADFSDLSACTFWLAPGQPLGPYTMRAFATKPWVNATISVYAATVDTLEWARLDNVSLRKTPGATIPGTQCLEFDDIASSANLGSIEMLDSARSAATRRSAVVGNGQRPAGTGPGTAFDRSAMTPEVLVETDWIDLTDASGARLSLDSWLLAPSIYGEIQVRTGDGDWMPLLNLGSADDWTSIEIELDAWLGRRIALRLVWRNEDGRNTGTWAIRHWRVEVIR